MEHVRLGRTGLKVSRLCLGTMTFGVQCDRPASFAIMDRASEGGVTFFDTAGVYPIGSDENGLTEEIIGEWMEGKRARFIVATKCSGRTSGQPWDTGNSRKHIMDAVEASLRRLRTDYIDLYQIHQDDPNTPLEETLRTMDDLVRAGTVRYIGCSNLLAYRIARANGISATLGLARFDSVQPRYNLLFRETEREILPLCKEEGIGVIPYNPLAGGMLTGKHSASAGPTAGTRFTLGSSVSTIYGERYWHEQQFAAVERLKGIAAEAGMTLPGMAVAWVLANPVITAPIIGASRAEQLDDTLRAMETPLPADLKARLDAETAEFRRGDTLR